MSDELDVEIAEAMPEPLEGHTYTIKKAEIITTPVRAYKGLRVTLVNTDGTECGTMLWMRGIAGEHSKLGSFVSALGKVPNAWLGKKIKFAAWREKQRIIELVP